MDTQRRKFLKVALKTYILLLTYIPQSMGFTGTRMRKSRRLPPGPLLTTQVMLILSAMTNSKTLRTTQTLLSVAGKDTGKTQRTTQSMMIIAGNSV